VRVAGEGAAVDRVDFGKQLGERSYGGGFGGTLFPHNENAANSRVDGVEKEGCLHLPLAHYRTEWEGFLCDDRTPDTFFRVYII
jgi:hypothetical protein